MKVTAVAFLFSLLFSTFIPLIIPKPSSLFSRFIFILVLLTGLSLAGIAQQQPAVGRPANLCGVTASFYPGNDSVLTLSQVNSFNFVNTSTNATSYQFWVNRFPEPANTPITNYGFNVGLTQIKLVAYNGTCTDTAICYYFQPGEFPPDTNNTKLYYGQPSAEEYIRGFERTSDGGFLIAGTREPSSFLNISRRGFLIKTKASGCVDWSFMVDSTNYVYSQTYLDKIAVSPDGHYYAAGFTETQIPFIARFTPTGTISWSKKMVQPILNNYPVPFAFHAITATPDGGVIITGNVNNNSLYLARLDAAGNSVWQRIFQIGDEMYPGALNSFLIKDGAIYLSGVLSYRIVADITTRSLLMKFDLADGHNLWNKRIYMPNGEIGMGNLIGEDSTILMAALTGAGTPGLYNTGSVIRLDTAGTVRSVSTINGTWEYYATKPVIKALSGKQYYMLSAGFLPLNLQPGISYQTKIAKLDSNFNVRWSKHHAAIQLGQYFYAEPDSDESLVMAGNEIGNSVEYYPFSGKIVVRKLDSTGIEPWTDCTLSDQLMTRGSITVLQEPFTGLTESIVNYPVVPLFLSGKSYYPEMRYKCPDYVDSCSYLKVSGPASICNLSSAYTYKVHRNRACGQPMNWQISPGVTILNQTDTSVTVRFTAFGNFTIGGELNFSCFPIKDTIRVNVSSSSPPLNLGPDTTICPNNTLQLHAGNKYLTYLWNNGSTDSLLTVNGPGQYWIDVTDSCGNLLTDTITISPSAVVPISIGPDRTKCNNDTIQLNAPSGFLNYNWSPAYNINSQTAQNVVVNPLTDTIYTIMAEKTPGCFAYDTVRITVYQSPPVNLGADRSICTGDSLLLDAGPGFVQYNWNSGPTTQQLVVKTAGQYQLTATTAQGCISRDTFRLISVYALPVVTLNPDTSLCIGSSRVLDAGAGYVSYAWNTGAGTRTISVNGTGVYGVNVTDPNGCKGSDTTIINKMLPLPAGFLFADTAICSFGSIELTASSTFSRYNWSTGSTSSVISITQPGTYWLDATDRSNCTGRDSVIVNPKECLKGLYVPSGFTPNGDGKNDVLKPFLFGNIRQYEFRVFNRWGETVFVTKDPNAGWNGLYKGIPQDAAVFIWTCRYQLEGEEVKTGRGTVVLIR